MQLWKLYQKPMPSYCRRASLLINPVSCRELHWIRAGRAAVLLHHQEKTLLDRAREKLQSRFSLGCSGREQMRDCQKICGAGMTEGTTAALFQLGCSKKGQFPGHSQLPEEGLTGPECKGWEGRMQILIRWNHNVYITLSTAFCPSLSSGCLIIWCTLCPLYVEQPNSPFSLPFSSLEEDRWWVVNAAQVSCSPFWPHRGSCCPSLQSFRRGFHCCTHFPKPTPMAAVLPVHCRTVAPLNSQENRVCVGRTHLT